MGPEKTILVPLAPGFEELEAVAVVDVLRRAELDVTLAGLAPGPVQGSHGITLETDCALDELDRSSIAALVLPGGQPGTDHLMADERILSLVRELRAAERPTAAICAAPMVLARAGILEGLPATSHPSVRDRLCGAEVLGGPRVVRAGTVVTSQGPGTALEFALALVEALKDGDTARTLERAMLVASPAD